MHVHECSTRPLTVESSPVCAHVVLLFPGHLAVTGGWRINTMGKRGRFNTDPFTANQHSLLLCSNAVLPCSPVCIVLTTVILLLCVCSGWKLEGQLTEEHHLLAERETFGITFVLFLLLSVPVTDGIHAVLRGFVFYPRHHVEGNDFVVSGCQQNQRRSSPSMEASTSTSVPTFLPSPTPSSPGYLHFFQEYQAISVLVEHYNYTGKLKDRYREGLKPEGIAFLVVCLLIVLENAVVLVAIWRNKKFHLPMYYLLGNLTLSDLLAGITYMANIIMSGPNTLKLTPLLWFLREGGVFITLAASVISLLAIAIERHVTMVTMRPYHGAKRGRMVALIGASWALAGFLGVLPILGWNCIHSLDQCSTVLPLYAKSYILFCVTVFSAVLLAIVVLYVRVFRIVRINTQRQRLGPSGSLRKGLARKSQKYIALLKTVTIVLGVFIACWLPLFLLLLLDFFCPTRIWLLYKADYFLGVAMVNSLLNPIIYTLTSKDMRRAILRLLCRPCLMTKDGQVKKIGMPFLECSFSKTELPSQKLEGGVETTVSSGNVITTPSPIKALYPKLFKS